MATLDVHWSGEYGTLQTTPTHALIPFTQLARLLDTSFILARLATGMETSQPEPQPLAAPGYLSGDEALEKIYGNNGALESLEKM